MSSCCLLFSILLPLNRQVCLCCCCFRLGKTGEFIAAANGSRYMCNEALIKQARTTRVNDQSTRLWFQIFVMFIPMGKIPILTRNFQRGWNHQPVNTSPVEQCNLLRACIFEPILFSRFFRLEMNLQVNCFSSSFFFFPNSWVICGVRWYQVLTTQIVVHIGPRDSPGVSRGFDCLALHPTHPWDCPTCLGFLFWRISGWCSISNLNGWPSTYIIHTRDWMVEASSLRTQNEREQLRLMGICLATQQSTSYVSSMNPWLLHSNPWNLIHPARGVYLLCFPADMYMYIYVLIQDNGGKL